MVGGDVCQHLGNHRGVGFAASRVAAFTSNLASHRTPSRTHLLGLAPMRRGVQRAGRIRNHRCAVVRVVRRGVVGRRVDQALPGRQGRLLFGYLVLFGSQRVPRDSLVDVEVATSALHAAESAVARQDWRRAWSLALTERFVARREFLPEAVAPWAESCRERSGQRGNCWKSHRCVGQASAADTCAGGERKRGRGACGLAHAKVWPTLGQRAIYVAPRSSAHASGNANPAAPGRPHGNRHGNDPRGADRRASGQAISTSSASS
jgi:hypothetical protein